MSQFCRNCGTKIPDNAAFCPSCGTQAAQNQNANTQPQSAPPAYQALGHGKKPGAGSKKKTVGLLAGIGALILVAVIIVILVSGGGGYKSVINKYFNAMETGKVKQIIECYPPQLREEFEYYMGDIESYLKAIKSINHKIIDAEHYDKNEIENLEYEYSYYDDMKIEDAYMVEVDIKLKMDYSKLGTEYSEFSEFYDEMDDIMEETTWFIVLKTKGKWYLIDEY